MRNIRTLLITLLTAILGAGCGALPLRLPGLAPTSTVVLPTDTAIQPSPTLPPEATFTPIAPPTGQPSATFTPIATFTGTSAPSATTAPAQSATPGPAGSSIGYGNVTLLLPGSLGSDTTNTTTADVEFPFLNPSGGDMPQHVKLVISGYPLQGTLLQPQIMVFPAAQYAQYTDYTRRMITALQNTTFYDGQPRPEGLPDGPFDAHVQSVQFVNGRGIRYLTQFDQAVLPVNNHELIYFFHGLTNPGDYYVEAILPVQASFLAPDENPASPLPPGGIPFDTANLGSYFQDVANKLNAMPPGGFTPSLSTLDALIQSISVGSVP